MIYLTIPGVVPSKKNAWKRGLGGRVYLPAQIQADIDALILETVAARNRHNPKALANIAGKRVRVDMRFYVIKENKDLDNVFTTMLDVLQKAGILENDKLVRAFSVEEEKVQVVERVEITINTLSTYPQ